MFIQLHAVKKLQLYTNHRVLRLLSKNSLTCFKFVSGSFFKGDQNFAQQVLFYFSQKKQFTDERSIKSFAAAAEASGSASDRNQQGTYSQGKSAGTHTRIFPWR